MNGVSGWDTAIGLAGIAVWGMMCGLPALVLYSVAARSDTGVVRWIVLIVAFLVWFPLVTVLCVWAYGTLIGIKLL
ncbi:MAG: hypothetical protein J2P20_11030 [Pseudonocardia sp.]|nr:hypothetical protein [Pseudonocardia sp.]MBO0878518.1 hypothetical protein [Pseudonocardia sp.]